MPGLLSAPIDCLRNFSSRAIRGRQETGIDQQAECAATVTESIRFERFGTATKAIDDPQLLMNRCAFDGAELLKPCAVLRKQTRDVAARDSEELLG